MILKIKRAVEYQLGLFRGADRGQGGAGQQGRTIPSVSLSTSILCEGHGKIFLTD